MKNDNNKIIKHYLKELSDYIACRKSVKCFYMKEIEQLLISFADDKPELTLEMLYEEFGSPEKFANELSERDEYAAMLKKARRKAKVWMVIGITFSILFLLSVCCMVHMFNDLSGVFDIVDLATYQNIFLGSFKV